MTESRMYNISLWLFLFKARLVFYRTFYVLFTALPFFLRLRFAFINGNIMFARHKLDLMYSFKCKQLKKCHVSKEEEAVSDSRLRKNQELSDAYRLNKEKLLNLQNNVRKFKHSEQGCTDSRRA